MPRHRASELTDAELRLMHVLWTLPPATVRTVLGALRGRPHLVYNTVLTTLRILEQKGYVTHRRSGRAFVFRARMAIAEARRRALRHLVARLYEGSPVLFVDRLFTDCYLEPVELDQITRRFAARVVA